MPWGAAIGAIGAIAVASIQSDAASSASAAQTDAANKGVAEQQRQFDAVQKLLAPYVNAGSGALGQQQALLGLSGADSQQAAIQALQNSPQFTSMLKQGENSILANASATGGLRGGNTQAALAQFSPNLLAQTINDQYARLGGITSLGQNSAAMTGNAGMQTGNNVAALLQQVGAANAGNALAQGRIGSNLVNQFGQLGGYYFGRGGTTPSAGGADWGWTGAEKGVF